MRVVHKLAVDVAAGLIVVLVFLFIEWMGFAVYLRSGIELMLEPLLANTSQISQHFFVPILALREQSKAAAKLRELEQAHSQLLAKLVKLEDLVTENNYLRALINSQQQSTKIIITSPITAYGFTSIGVGANQGVSVGRPVLVAKTVIGLISAVTPQQSKVTLLSQMKNELILAKTENGVEGLISGDGKKIIFSEIPSDVKVKIGEKIISVGQSNLPANLLIGTVQKIIDSPTSPTQTAIIEQLVSFYEVPIIEVIP